MEEYNPRHTKECDIIPAISAAVMQGDINDVTTKTAQELLNVSDKLGLALILKDANLNTISAQIHSVKDFLLNPVAVAALTQTFYVSTADETTWFNLTVKRGKISSLRFLITVRINWVKIVNQSHAGFDFLIVGYSGSYNKAVTAATIMPQADFLPKRITRHFPLLVGETSVDTTEVGKLLCHLISKRIHAPTPEMHLYFSSKQGFYMDADGKTTFCPPHPTPAQIIPFLTPSVRARQHPCCNDATNADMTPILKPLFAEHTALQIALLFRMASLLLFLFAKKGIFPDNVLITKKTPQASDALLTALLKNTAYDSLDSPSVGPHIKPLQFALSTVNDGIVVVRDNFCGDQIRKSEKGYDLILNDLNGAISPDDGVHHIVALISESADLYIPSDRCCVLRFDEMPRQFSTEDFKIALKRLDANLIARIEHGCNYAMFLKDFDSHVTEVRKVVPNRIPASKQNLWIILTVALRIYNEWYSPLFGDNLQLEIAEWLSAQEQKSASFNDIICSEFGQILNRKIDAGFFKFTLKEDVTIFDKGCHAVIVDTRNRCIYMETAESFTIAKTAMKSVSDPDRVTTALYDCGYLPHNSRAEKSKRIAAETSDGTPYPLYVHALNFSLLNAANRQRLNLIDKEACLFRHDEWPNGKFLPLIKVSDGRFAGKMLDFEAEASHHYFGSGRSGSGKSWGLGQLMPMLKMLNCNVVALDTSSSFTEAQLRKMLPTEVVEQLFRFVHIGAGKDPLPIDLGSLAGCCNLADCKRLIYQILSAAVGKFDHDKSKDNQQRSALKTFLSSYLKGKTDRVDLAELTENLKKSSILSARVSGLLNSIFQELKEIGCDQQGWSELIEDNPRILILQLGNEIGDSTHIMLDLLTTSLRNWQHMHNKQYLAIFIDELNDQNFASHSPLTTILKQGRKDHIIMLGATQDFYSQGSSSQDVLKQATIKSFARPGKAEDRIAQKLGFINSIDAGFNRFKPGDVIMEFEAYNRDTAVNEPELLRGRVVDFVETPLYLTFKHRFCNDSQIASPEATDME